MSRFYLVKFLPYQQHLSHVYIDRKVIMRYGLLRLHEPLRNHLKPDRVQHQFSGDTRLHRTQSACLFLGSLAAYLARQSKTKDISSCEISQNRDFFTPITKLTKSNFLKLIIWYFNWQGPSWCFKLPHTQLENQSENGQQLWASRRGALTLRMLLMGMSVKTPAGAGAALGPGGAMAAAAA